VTQFMNRIPTDLLPPVNKTNIIFMQFYNNKLLRLQHIETFFFSVNGQDYYRQVTFPAISYILICIGLTLDDSFRDVLHF
jgi:hypothetical protein